MLDNFYFLRYRDMQLVRLVLKFEEKEVVIMTGTVIMKNRKFNNIMNSEVVMMTSEGLD